MSKKSTKSAPKAAPSYEQRDIVLGKIRGFPPWPGMIVDPETVPTNVLDERPQKKANFYCVRFFPAGDFAWLVNKDISKLQTREIEAYINEPYKKSGDLLTGYRIALDPTKWEEERAQNVVYAGEPEEEIDELDSDGAVAKKAKSKKRKRDSEAGTSTTKAKKAPKSKKEPTESTKKALSSSKGRKNGPRSKAMVESEDEADGEPDGEEDGPNKRESPPPPKKTKRDREDDAEDPLTNDPEAVRVRDWRHKLQKAFLGKLLPDPADMPTYDALFTTVEQYDKINIQYLQFSKIGKVMRHITVLTPDKVPRDDEFKFRDRAKALVDQWHQVLNANKPANGAEETTNGKVEKDDAAVVKGAAAIDLNGKEVEATEDPTAATGDADADAVGETSMGDITMMTDM